MTPIQQITSQEAYDLIMQDKAILMDVRESEEFLEWRIPYAVFLPMSIFAEHIQGLTFPSDKMLIIQCKSGGRSQKIAEYLEQARLFDNPVANLAGGITAWGEAGLITVKAG